MRSSNGGGGNDAMRRAGNVPGGLDDDLDDIPVVGEVDDEAPTRVVTSDEMLREELLRDESGTQDLEPSPAPRRGPPPPPPGVMKKAPSGPPSGVVIDAAVTMAPPSRARGEVANDQQPPEEEEEKTFVLDEALVDAFGEGDEAFEVSRSGAKARDGQEVAPAPTKSKRVEGEELYLGRAFGGFRIVRGIASGGMASVFLGRKEALGGFTQHAAIKIVHERFATEGDFIDMFLDEARIAARIQHPNVCRVLDFGQAEDTFYLALEYVHGETWTRVLRALLRSDWSGSRYYGCVAYVLAQACEGLHAAHNATNEQGQPLHIVHRDISPDNLLVGYDGTVRVLDFGVAHAEARLTNTRAGVVKGRLAYMAPEQARGEGVDHRADIWSLGVVLRESLEGRRLFKRDSEAETILAVTHEPLPEWRHEIPAGLRAIVDCALSREPSQRFATARDMGRALTQFLHTHAEPVSMADVSVQLEEVFPEERKQKLHWLTQPIPASAPVAPRGASLRPSGLSDPSQLTPTAAPPARQATLRLDAAKLPTLQGVVPQRRQSIDRSGWLALGVACLAALIVGSLWVSRLMSRPAPRPVPVLVPATPDPPAQR